MVHMHDPHGGFSRMKAGKVPTDAPPGAVWIDPTRGVIGMPLRMVMERLAYVVLSTRPPAEAQRAE
jgi:hypothetical protein